MGLRDISLKHEYRTDRDDIVSEFFIPCLSNCTSYDRCVEYVSLRDLTAFSSGFDDFARNRSRLRIICGHRFAASDLEFISRLFSDDGRDFSLKGNMIKDSKIRMLRDIIEAGQVEIKIAIPNSEDIVGSFSERAGIFADDRGDMVTFTGTSSQTFNLLNKNFESMDVFTSWDDKARVEAKVSRFEELWQNRTQYVEVYDFGHAQKHNMLKYSSRWAIEV